MVKLPELKIGKLIAKVPIIQGGMAIRLSTARLAAAVANEGGIGLIAASGMPFEELRHEIRLARKLTPNGGIVGINVMVAARQFKELVAVAIEEGIDLVVAGAGFSRDMFSWGKESGTPIVPIVSSAKLAKISQTLGAAAIIVEGAEAGGHLGTNRSSREIVPEVRAAVKLPVIGAGGVLYGRDIMEMLKLGADGVQMGSRFAASVESNGSEEIKKKYTFGQINRRILSWYTARSDCRDRRYGRRFRNGLCWTMHRNRSNAMYVLKSAVISTVLSGLCRGHNRAMWKPDWCFPASGCVKYMTFCR